jgi:hypothetical protein
MLKKGKKAQAWGLDLMIAVTIFIIGVVLFYFYALNYSSESKTIIDSLQYEGESISSSLLSDGYPEDWNSTNVVVIGLTTNDKINNTKLDRFYSLVQEDYNKTRTLFSTKYNYYINFSEPIIISGQQKSYIGLLPENEKNVIKVSRITIFKDKPATLDVVIWE